MARLPPLTRPELDPDQLQLWDGLTGNRGGGVELVDEHGGLVGPFNSWLYVPKIGRRLSSLGAHLRFGTSIPRHLAEIAICTVGAHWHSEFEFWAHAPMAIDHGVEPAVIEALRSGAEPVFDTDEERLVHQVATQLLNDRRVDDVTYAGARRLLGDPGMVELVALIGYYCLISMLLNLFEVPLPTGEVPSWPDGATATAG